MTSLFVFLLFGLNSKNIFCLIVFDIDHVKVTHYGTATIEAFLLAVDIFMENKGPYEGCDVDFHPTYTRFCDIVIFTRLCMIDSKTPNQYTPDSFMNKHTFTVDENSKYKIIPILDLNCGSIKVKELAFQQNKFYAINPTDELLNTITQPYSEILVFTCYTGDQHWAIYGKIFYYGIYAENTIGFKTVIQKDIKTKWTKYLSVFQTVMLHEYFIIVKCASDFFGKTCWFNCVDNARHTCNCEYMESYSNVPCKPQCKPGWLATYVIYEVEGVNEGLQNCILLDLCYDNTDCKFHCLPIDNVTFACEKLLSSIRSNFHPSNITSDIFLYSELLTVSLDYDSLQLKDIAINTTISFNADSFTFGQKILSYRYGETQSVFQVLRQDYIDIPLHFYFNLNLQNWEKTIYKFKLFRIYVKPKKLFIYGLDDQTIKVNKIYIGEKLFCNSTAKPSYRTLYIWSIQDDKYFFQETMKVAKDVIVTRMKISIKAILIIKGRPNEQLIYSINPFIKAFVYLKWNLNQNVLEKKDVLECQFKAFVEVTITIFQLSGSTPLNTFNPQIPLKDAKGGTYELLCVLSNHLGAHFSRKIKFQMKGTPSFVCLFLFTNTVGSIVQCSHNGYLYDEYNIIVSLNIFNSYWQVKIEGTGYIRIPYYMYFLKYMISCNITSKFNSTFSITHNKVYTLLENIQGRYDILKEYRKCPEFASYVEKPQIFEYTFNEVIMKHFIFYLKDSDFNLLVLCILFLMFLLSFYSTSLILIIIFQHVNNKETVLRDRIEKQIKITRRGYLLRRLCHEAKEKVLFDKKYSSYSILKL